MSNPVRFSPRRVDPKLELQQRLVAAPIEHAEALLVAFDLLEEAHRQGVLDALHGVIGAKDAILASLMAYSAEPANINAIRNLMVLGKIFGTLEPEPLSHVARAMLAVVEEHKAEKEPPGLWQLLKRMRGREARRGISLTLRMLAAVGDATGHSVKG